MALSSQSVPREIQNYEFLKLRLCVGELLASRLGRLKPVGNKSVFIWYETRRSGELYWTCRRRNLHSCRSSNPRYLVAEPTVCRRTWGRCSGLTSNITSSREQRWNWDGRNWQCWRGLGWTLSRFLYASIHASRLLSVVMYSTRML